MSNIEIVLPAGSFGADEFDTALDKLLREIGKKYGVRGEWAEKYGANFENTVFLMHRYCWCEKDDCLWCYGCDCQPDGEYEFIVDGRSVSQKSYNALEAHAGPLPFEVHKHGTPEYEEYSKQWDAKIEERDRRRKIIYPAIVHVCEPRGLLTDRQRGESYFPDQRAPNFWHKASGFKVWWYKYIGRDAMTTRELSQAEFGQIWRDCLGEDDWPDVLK